MMKHVWWLAVALALVLGLNAQTPAPAPAKKAQAPAAKAAASPVDDVIASVKAGLPETLIIKSLQSANQPMKLAPADLVKLKGAGVSDNIIGVMMDPGSTPAAAAAAPAPAPTPVAAPVAAPPVQTAVLSTSAPPPASAGKKRVIVDEFDYSTVMTSVQAVFGTTQNIGKGIRSMLVTRVAKDGKVVVVERAKMNQLLKEQDFNASNRVKQGKGARVGQVSGADALLTGDVVVFGRDDKKTNVRGGGIAGRVIGGIASSKNEDKAVVVIDYRLVDAETSEVIATGEARGESSRKGNALGGIGGVLGKGVGGVEVDMTSSNFAQTIIGEATQDCVDKLAAILNEQTTNMKANVREVETRVAAVSGGTLTIAAGSSDGVNAGEVFEIFKVLGEIRDPQTKEVLDTQVEKVGEMTVTSVREKVASGNYAGSPAIVNMVARKKLQ
ncbi:MAG TPA: CsgG/HfaB family protein [Bryobacteraceae bacterium]|nr:CsgG/HfaB family protein [Bryobacteraceae bacterium]